MLIPHCGLSLSPRSPVLVVLILVLLGALPLCSSTLSCQRGEVAEGALAKSLGCVAVGPVIQGPDSSLVEFQGGPQKVIKDPVTCFKTCRVVYPDRNLALIAWRSTVNGLNSSGFLDCFCAHNTALEQAQLGPDLFCGNLCYGVPCGGEYSFSNGIVGKYLSVYCVAAEPKKKSEDAPGDKSLELIQRTKRSATQKEEEEEETRTEDKGEQKTETKMSAEELQKTLDQIWLTLAHTNIVAIVTVALLVVIIILVLVLLVWLYSFMETFNATNRTHAAFYRTGPAAGTTIQPASITQVNKRQPLNEGRQAVDTYGATNVAFDPTPEPDPVFGNNIQPSDSSGLEDNLGENTSTFYPRGDSQEGADQDFDFDPPRRNTSGAPGRRPFDDDSGSQHSTETELADEIPGNGKHHHH